MKMKWFAAAALAAVCAVPAAQAQVGIYIGRTPPPLRYENRGPMPGPGYAWQDGYWGNKGGRYVWVGGRWNQTPYEGAYWSHPHYDHYRQGWQMHEGHWNHADADHHEEEHHDDRHDNRGHH